MGIAYYVVLERDIPGFDQWDMDGKLIANAAEQLADLAAQLKLTSLDDFLSADPEEIRDFLEMGPLEEEEVADLPEEMRAQIHMLNEEMNRALAEAQQEFKSTIAHDGKIPAEAWFPADDGLHTVRELIGYVGNHADEFDEPDELIDDLKGLEHILEEAGKNDVKFHLAIDF